MAAAAGKVGVVVVHGIGEQGPGEAAEEIVGALVAGADGRLESERVDETAFRVDVDGGAREVMVYEAYWAPELEPERGAYDVAKLQTAALFPRLNRRHGLYPTTVRRLKVWGWTVVLAFLSAVVFLASQGLSFLGRLGQAVVGTWREQRADGEGEAPARPDEYSWIDEKLDNVLGDIFRYVDAACPAAEPGSPADGILKRFHAALRRAFDDGCTDVHVFAHSLGTVVAYHGLSGYRVRSDDRIDLGRVSHVWTIGSPLEKIAFIWPGLTGLPRPDGMERTTWLNFNNRSDPVSGSLRSFPEWEISNDVVRGGGLLTAHTGYERNERIVAMLRDALLQPGETSAGAARAGRGWLRRALELGVLLAGLAVLLVGALLLLAAMAGIIGLFVLGAGWVVGLVFDGLGRRIRDLSWTIGLGFAVFSFVMLMLVNPFLVAAEAHSRWRPQTG